MPTVLRVDGYRFFFYSREEVRPHIHVQSAEGKAKFWLEPDILLAHSQNLSSRQVRYIEQIIKEHHNDFLAAWRRYFG